MSDERELCEPPGKSAPREKFKAEKSKQFLDYIEACRDNVVLIETRIIPETADVVVLSLKIERPQLLAHGIKREEVVAVLFSYDANIAPDVLCLRADFPSVPHVNLRTSEFPRSICLYEQPYEQVRLSWTPADFLQRIHHWFAATAKGNLHAEDQPLEPLIGGSNFRLIIPADFDPVEASKAAKPVSIFRIGELGNTTVLRAVWKNAREPQGKRDSVILPFTCPPQTHGVIRKEPGNLLELHNLCNAAGFNLASDLREVVKKWYIKQESLDFKLVILLYLPKTRSPGGKVEVVEKRAFLTIQTLREIGNVLGVIQQTGGFSGMLINQPEPSNDPLRNVGIGIVHVHSFFDPATAAALNNVMPFTKTVTAIGLGALGSQVFNNLLRSGFGKWTLIDDDIFLPHNAARHFLGSSAVGHSKVEALKDIADSMFDDGSFAEAINGNVLHPGDNADPIAKAINKCDLVLDMSASIAVSRHLADLEDASRAVSIFVSPDGNSLILTAEDRSRKIRLDWLEMLHYRAVLNEVGLSNSFQSADSRVRYGHSCRDVTTRLPQDSFSIWAGIASKNVKTIAEEDNASVRIFASDKNGAISCFSQDVEAPLKLGILDWAIQFDSWLLQKLNRIREERLPNETGGVLLGAFDTARRVCSIVDFLPSPPDSKVWPTSYIRGCQGLQESVRQVQKQTLGQLNYVGEWHSHPRGASTNPSSDDFTAYSWLVENMNIDSLPAIMMIIGENRQFRLVSTEPSTENALKKE